MFQALQGDCCWLDTLKQGNTPTRFKVHSIFRHVINLQDEAKKLYTLVGRNIPLAPSTIQLSCPDMQDLGIEKSTMLTGGRGRLIWDKGEIFLWAARKWQCILPVCKPFQKNTHITLIDCLLSAADAATGRGGIAQNMEEILQQKFAAFLEGWQQADDTLMKESLWPCIGFGIGLTPSGDDRLIGLLAVLALPYNPQARVFMLLAGMIDAARGRTTDVSYAALIHAKKRRFNQALTACLQAFFMEDQNILQDCLKKLLSLGATSGVDMLKGMKIGLSMLTKRE